MAVKEWFRRLQPVQLYVILFLTSSFFIVEIVATYVTHALTLLANAYHMLCNIVALVGCIASIKYAEQDNYRDSISYSVRNTSISLSGETSPSFFPPNKIKHSYARSERRMKNTFGWARIDILTMLSCCVLLASFCFSILAEALGTLAHIHHSDEMHYPLPVFFIGASGVFLNVFCYILIGGFTFHQNSFLHVTSHGDIILKRSTIVRPARESQQKLAAPTRRSPLVVPRRQAFRELCRDVLGCILVMVVSLLVYYTDKKVAKFLDPIVAIFSATSLFVLSYPYMKQSSMILLQTIPNHINIDSLKKELLHAFPGIVNVHDLHVWQLTGEKVISTAHIIFLDPRVYISISDQVTAFFIEMGITQVTIQPEFQKIDPIVEEIDCLIRCQGELCRSSQCCSKEELTDDLQEIKSVVETQTINKKFDRKEIIPVSPMISLRRFTLPTVELPGFQQPTSSLRELNVVELVTQCSYEENAVCAAHDSTPADRESIA